MIRSHIAKLKSACADWTAIALRLSAWVFITALAALGFLLVLLFVLGGFSMEGLFAHLENLGRRYGDAPAEARASFHLIVSGVAAAAFAIFAMMRGQLLLAIFNPKETVRGD